MTLYILNMSSVEIVPNKVRCPEKNEIQLSGHPQKGEKKKKRPSTWFAIPFFCSGCSLKYFLHGEHALSTSNLVPDKTNEGNVPRKMVTDPSSFPEALL